MADLPFNSLFGIKVIKSEMMPKNKVAFIGKSDTLSKGGLSKTEYPRVREWFEGAKSVCGHDGSGDGRDVFVQGRYH
jgi:hypothetical protein